MAFKTNTLASIYEIQGYKEEAMMIYEEILAKDPKNMEASAALVRLKTQKHNFSGVNRDKLELFVNARTASDYQKLEKWLLQWS